MLYTKTGVLSNHTPAADERSTLFWINIKHIKTSKKILKFQIPKSNPPKAGENEAEVAANDDAAISAAPPDTTEKLTIKE